MAVKAYMIMIDIKKLLVGNAIRVSTHSNPQELYNDFDYEIVERINTEKDVIGCNKHDVYSSDCLYSISITDDSLRRLGFYEQEYESNEYQSTTFHYIQVKGKRIVIHNNKMTYNFGGDIQLDTEIEYIHNLQNIIFLIFGIMLKFEIS